jgi:quercetin dioxygenase-like cupin family protein
MDHYNWTEIPEEKMSPLLSRQVIHTERMTIARLRILKGAIVPLHHHENEQVSMIDKGSLRFEVDGTEIVVKAGEALRIPPNAPHLVEATEDCLVTDYFAPPRQDWISGDDSYLRR